MLFTSQKFWNGSRRGSPYEGKILMEMESLRSSHPYTHFLHLILIVYDRGREGRGEHHGWGEQHSRKSKLNELISLNKKPWRRAHFSRWYRRRAYFSRWKFYPLLGSIHNLGVQEEYGWWTLNNYANFQPFLFC